MLTSWKPDFLTSTVDPKFVKSNFDRSLGSVAVMNIANSLLAYSKLHQFTHADSYALELNGHGVHHELQDLGS